MNQIKYLMSFTTGGLFYTESLSLLDLYQGDWVRVYAQALEKNTLQTRVESTAKRVLREIIGRLKTLTDEELELLGVGSAGEQKYLLWLGVCRRYVFIHEFASEVIRERYLTLKHDVPAEEFEIFFNAKERWHEELEKIAVSTKDKLRTVLYKILRDAEIVDANKLILPAMLTDELIRVVAKHDVNDLMIFPVSDTDLQRAMERCNE
jgi:hypothetical protein